MESVNNLPWVRRYTIIGLHYYQNYDFRFQDQVNIMVGESGLGKTKILHLLYLTLTGSWMSLAKQMFDFLSVEFQNGSEIAFAKGELEFMLLTDQEIRKVRRQKKIVADKFIEIQMTIHKSIQGEVIYFPVYRDLIDDLGLIGKRFDQAVYSNEYSRDEQLEYHRIANEILIPTNLADLTGNVNRSFLKADIEMLTELCNSYLIGIKMKEDADNIIQLVNVTTDEVVDLYQLSSGEKQIVYFFLKVFLAGSDRVYILFDEPELSIPINWQRRLLVDLGKLRPAVFMLVITHSPFVFENDFDRLACGINKYKM
jgi:energy-coupling factor transporter ATP-binding protein EcfA2